MWFSHHLVFLVPHKHGEGHGEGTELAVQSAGHDDDDEGASCQTGGDSPQAAHDETESRVLQFANMVSMICIGLVPYCVNSTVAWKGLPKASTFPVFCLGVIVVVYTAALMVVLHCLEGPPAKKREVHRALLLQFPTALLLMVLASLSHGGWSIDIVIFVSPLPMLLHTPAVQLWSRLRDRNAGTLVFR